jgi:hypothetical protein
MLCAGVLGQNVNDRRERKLNAETLENRLPDAGGFIVREIMANIPLS